MDPYDSGKCVLVSGESLSQIQCDSSQNYQSIISSQSSSSSSYACNHQDELLAIALNLKAGIDHLRTNLDMLKSEATADKFLVLIDQFSNHIEHVSVAMGKEIKRIVHLNATFNRSSSFAIPQVITKGAKKLKLSPLVDSILDPTDSLETSKLSSNNPVDEEADEDENEDDDTEIFP
uniref:Uncharacterized protein n=1 Tax=Tetranychus urticae TaxID=32264 RepID=T1KZJ0_TETUR